MKTILLSISLFFALTAISQEFAPTGAEWYYHENFFLSGEVDYIKFKSEKDTLIFGEICKKITKRHKISCNDRPEIEYLFSRNDTVFFLDTAFKEFQILYDLNANASESWIIKVKDWGGRDIDTITITVDSTSTTIINGQELKALYVTYSKADENSLEIHTSTIIERIGDIQYMFNWYPWSNIACDGNYTIGIRCYQDSSLGLYSTGLVDSCDYITGIKEKEYGSKILKIYPNPVINKLNFHFLQKHVLGQMQLFDLMGREYQITPVKESRLEYSLNLEGLKKGVYLIKLQLTNGGEVSRKIIKD